MRLQTLAFLVLTGPALAQEDAYDFSYWTGQSPTVAAIVSGYQTECDAEGGALISAGYGEAVTEMDLDGDGAEDDLVIDMGKVVCSTAFTLWAGTGGSPIHFILDGTAAASWSGHVWEVERLGTSYPSVILIGRHGSACDGAGADPCVQAVVPYQGRFFTVRYPRSNEEGD